MPTLSHHDKQQVLRLLSQQNQVKYIFDKFARESAALLAGWQGGNIPESVTTSEVWIRNANVEKKIDLLLSDLHDSLIKNIDANTRAAWEAGNVKTDDLIKDFIKDLAISESVKSGMFARNHEALKAYMSRKIDGASVSDRVWKIAEGTKENLEYYLSSGISTGRSAAVISQDVRQLLNNPDKRFRRVRNEEGKLVLSKPMKNYHPGTGVYRSSYKNALRLAATETNIAYHTADYERWKKLDFVVGIKVGRSPWAKGPCPICDAMKGIYPKGFKFIPWHPFCICQAVPQMLSGEEFADFLITGNVPSDKIIRNMPETALSYANENKHYQRAYAYTENRKFFEDDKAYKSSSFDPNAAMKARRSEIFQQAKILKGQTFSNEEFGKPISISRNGAKEWLNQPYIHYEEKNEMLLNIGDVIKNSKYMGYTDYTKGNPMIAKSHVFSTKVKGDVAYILVWENILGEFLLHSISESEKVLEGIKK